jgi:hypothetical protein
MADKLHQRQKSALHIDPANSSNIDNKSQVSSKRTQKRIKKQFGKWNVPKPVAIISIILCILLFVLVSKKSYHDKQSNRSLRSAGNHQTSTDPDLDTMNIDTSKICINRLEDMPKQWRPLPDIFEDTGKPWSKKEQKLADEAVEKGLDELIQVYANMTKKEIKELKNDAVNSLIDEAYASASMPSYHQKALHAASRVLQINAAKFANRKKDHIQCEHMYEQLKYVGYGQYLVNNLPEDTSLHELQKNLVSNVNKMIQVCGTLEKLLDVGDLNTIFTVRNEHADPVFGWVLEAIAIVDCLTVPDLKLPDGSEEFVANVWKYLSDYDLPYARNQKKHYSHYPTRNTAWLATHLAYIPTGYGRHVQRIEDAPYLYQYIRGNFYYALEYGMLDLFSEFVDLVRQYGCTEDNDYQVRHGTRYVLSLYKKGGNSWINYRENDQDDGSLGNYDLIHKPWTGISAVIRRKFEPIVPGSYGYAFQKALDNVSEREKSIQRRSLA